MPQASGFRVQGSEFKDVASGSGEQPAGEESRGGLERGYLDQGIGNEESCHQQKNELVSLCTNNELVS